MTDSTDNGPSESRSRDASVASILGLFFVVLALPVAAGALSATLGIDRALSLAAAGLLLLVGGLFLWTALRWRAASRE